jgi:hypothetical protein
MASMRAGFCLAFGALLAVTMGPVAASAASSAAKRSAAIAVDVSSQERAPLRRARTRIEVHPLPGPLRRECVAVFQERYIPQWGGLVLYPGQRCWWTRGPL